MDYEQTLDFLFNSLPMYQRVGVQAFKKDLKNTLALCSALDSPQDKFKSVHVAGTNGKGSSCHAIASVLQAAGYKTGLYTSPHLTSFTERIRINGIEIDKDSVVDFVATNKGAIEAIQPSFFEMTVAMAFDYFAKQKVDIAIVEVGLGGRLDSTNVIMPEVSLITNIGLDHTDMLGETLKEISIEKGGIIKPGVPVVIGTTQLETASIFENIASSLNAPITFADRTGIKPTNYELDLKGAYQKQNIAGVLSTLELLRDKGFRLSSENIKTGLSTIIRSTGFKGRWQTINDYPLTICDTGHNGEAFKWIVKEIALLKKNQVHMVLGFVNDKNVSSLLAMLPKYAILYFCRANVPRAMDLKTLRKLAETYFPKAQFIEDVNDAIRAAQSNAEPDDLIFVGGSTFVVAEIKEL